MNFDEALRHTLTFEGGYADVPGDRGGETFRGISRNNWPAWAGWDLIDQVKRSGVRRAKDIDAAFRMDAEMEMLVASFYRDNFWEPFERLELPPLATAKLFDTAVNVGLGRAIKWMQSVIGASADGAVGPQTMAAAKAYFARPGAEDNFLASFITRQKKHYLDIVARNKSQEKFLKGWLRRAIWKLEAK